MVILDVNITAVINAPAKQMLPIYLKVLWAVPRMWMVLFIAVPVLCIMRDKTHPK